MAKIETPKQAADTMAAMSPANISLLVAGLRAQHPHLRNAKDKDIRAMLRNFMGSNK